MIICLDVSGCNKKERPMKRAIRVTSTAIGCLGVVLAMAGSRVCAAPQNQSQSPPYTLAEYNAFKAQSAEQDWRVRLRLLDDFTAQYPDSALMPYIYESYSNAYFSLKNYPQAVAFTDRLLALTDKVDLGTRLSALAGRAMSYSAGCDDSAFQTTDAAAKAKDAAAQGLQLLSQLPKPSHLTDEAFGAVKTWYGMIFNSAERIAESRLNGDPVVCVPPPQMTDPVRFGRIIQNLRDELRQIAPAQ
jgi:hypothetical protein